METHKAENKKTGPHSASAGIFDKDFSGEIFKRDVVSVSPETSLLEVAKLMKDEDVGNVVVVKKTESKMKPVGIITDRDLVLGVLAQKKSLDELKVSDLMTHPIIVVHERDGIYSVIKTMKENGIGRLPIVDDNANLVGIITAKRLLQLLSKEMSDLLNVPNRKHKGSTLTH